MTRMVGVFKAIHLSFQPGSDTTRRIILLSCGLAFQDHPVPLLRRFPVRRFVPEYSVPSVAFPFFQDVFSQRVLPSDDLRFGKPARSHFHHRPLHFAARLPSQQIRWQFPISGIRQHRVAHGFVHALCLSANDVRDSRTSSSFSSQFQFGGHCLVVSIRFTSRISNSSSTLLSQLQTSKLADFNRDRFLVFGLGTD